MTEGKIGAASLTSPAKEKIKGELENYRLSIMRIREKNLKMKQARKMLS